jgi:arsenate reductase
MFNNLSKTIAIVKEIPVSIERQAILQPLVDYIQDKVNNQEEIRLNFICTHNSRVGAKTRAYSLCGVCKRV